MHAVSHRLAGEPQDEIVEELHRHGALGLRRPEVEERGEEATVLTGAERVRLDPAFRRPFDTGNELKVVGAQVLGQVRVDPLRVVSVGGMHDAEKVDGTTGLPERAPRGRRRRM